MHNYVRSAIPPYPISCPDSASFRCLNALRYFVRSYVTRPTTIRAITETPANTPRPIGRTDNFFPGSVKAAWEDALAAAAEADEAAAAAEDDAESGAAVPVAVVEADKPLDVTVAEDDVGDGIAEDATVDTPLTVTAGITLGDPVVLAAELVGDVLVVLVLFTEEVVWVPEELVEDEVAADDATEAVDEVVDDPSVPPCESLLALPLETPPETPPELSLSNVNVHCFTSCTCGFPPTMIGVSVILHVSVDGPIEVFVWVTVVTVVAFESSRLLFGRRTEVSYRLIPDGAACTARLSDSKTR